MTSPTPASRCLARAIGVAAMVLLAGPALAEEKVREVWQAEWDGGRCTLVLDYDSGDMAGKVSIRRPCGGLLRGVKSFAYLDDAQAEMVFLSAPGQRGDVIGHFEEDGRAAMIGLAGDGEPVALFLVEQTRRSARVTTGGATGGCVRYADGGCADKADLKNPKIRFGDTIEMYAHEALDIFPFAGGKGFKKDERVAEGSCREVKRCRAAEGGDWCEVVLEDGFFTGWVKRMDRNRVYLSRGC